jgi:hypothetical protein
LEFHIKKDNIDYTPIDNEREVQESIFYENGDKTQPVGIQIIDKKFRGFVHGKKNEHDIVGQLSKRDVNHHNYLLLYHWYERKYNINIIQGDNYIITSPNRKVRKVNCDGGYYYDIKDKGLIREVHVRNDDIHELVWLKYINESIDSKRFKGFSVFYEYFYDFFPGIERLNFKEFIGIEFLEYLLNLFPHIKWINYTGVGNYSRYNFSNKSRLEFEEKFGYEFLEYESGIPVFFPTLPGRDNDYDYTSLVVKTSKEIENEVRTELGLPKIGEGWISETTLYYQLKTYFKNEDVIHHGRPDWLGPQHVDIWFPDHSIGIEYQGIQHDRPVDFFGGEESFKKNIERDKRKKRLFKENKSLLIEVRKGYNLKKLIKSIEFHLKK